MRNTDELEKPETVQAWRSERTRKLLDCETTYPEKFRRALKVAGIKSQAERDAERTASDSELVRRSTEAAEQSASEAATANRLSAEANDIAKRAMQQAEQATKKAGNSNLLAGASAFAALVCAIVAVRGCQ